MRLYTLALFAHLLGVLGLFIGMGLQWTITVRLRRAQTVAQVREWSSLIEGVGRLGPASGALLLVAGIYMTATAWSMTTPWIVVSLAAMLFMMLLGMGVTTRRLKAVQRAAAPMDASAEAILPELHRRIQDPLLWIATQLAGSLALGVVFLMTTKPGVGGVAAGRGRGARPWGPRWGRVREALAESTRRHEPPGGGEPQLTGGAAAGVGSDRHGRDAIRARLRLPPGVARRGVRRRAGEPRFALPARHRRPASNETPTGRVWRARVGRLTPAL